MSAVVQSNVGTQGQSEHGPAGSDVEEGPHDHGSDLQVSRSVAARVTHVWEVLVSPAGSAALLGPGAVLGTKGSTYSSQDGHTGVVRSYHPLEQLRVSWHASHDSPPSVVELDLVEDGGVTRLELRHQHLHAAADGHLRDHWSQALDRLAELAEG